MNNKFLAVALSALVLAGCLAECAASKQEYKRMNVTVTDGEYNAVTDENGQALTTKADVKTDKDGNPVTEKVTDSKGNPVKDAAGNDVTRFVTAPSGSTTKPGADSSEKYVPSGWKRVGKSSRIRSEDGKVTADFDKLSYTSQDKVKQSMEALIQKGLSSAKLTSSVADGKTYTVTGYGVPVNSDTRVYYLLYSVTDKSGTYLVTFSAQQESYLDADFSAVTDNIKELGAY